MTLYRLVSMICRSYVHPSVNGIMKRRLLTCHRSFGTSTTPSTPSTTSSSSSSSSSKRTCVAIAFDIDGVLLRGKQIISQATNAMKQVTCKQDGGDGQGIPHVFLTNGGGVPEYVKAQQLENHFNIKINPQYVICSHTPMRELVQKYGQDTVLVVGMSAVREVAQYYGFKHVVTPEDLMHQYPALVPHITERSDYKQSLEAYQRWREAASSTLNFPTPEQLRSISAVLVLHDPLDWYRDLQLCTDVLLGYIHTSPPTYEHQHVPIYFSNPDLLFSGRAPHPRLAQGGFRVALGALFKAISGAEMKYTLYGKPERVTYQYAEQLLLQRAREMGYDDITTIYGIGDNPHADIRGANAAGGRWKSVLVKTGTIKTPPSDSSHSDIPHYEFDHVDDAVTWIQQQQQQQT